MTRAALRRYLRKHRGAMARIARELGISDSTVSQWFSGKVDSQRIEAAVRARVKELLEQEAADAEQAA